MTVKLEDAVERCNERLMVIAGDQVDEHGAMLDQSSISKMLIGTDLRVEEIGEIADKKAMLMLVALVESDMSIRELLNGVYFQGVIEGVTFAAMRAEEEAENGKR